ncbi:MAG: insulinase family protein [Acidobacteriota bacterium]|nr:insulinase family protein [Acidobacteriota bacterium]
MRKISAILLLVIFAAFTVSAQLKITPLNIKERTLANGLKIVSVQDNSSPAVAVQVWYNVGSKNDPVGRSGFAHLFEHLMFKSTKNMKSEMIDRITEDVGGEGSNASTSDDFTDYIDVVPSNNLEALIWAEADRMVNLNVDEANFKSERAVVEEEFRQSVLAQPYGQFGEAIQQQMFDVHPYKRTTIGSIEDLEAATNSDAEKFYKTFYRPDNAMLVVVGDFDQAQFDGWVNKYFNKVNKPNGAIPRVTVTEPARTKEKRLVVKVPNVPLPAVSIGYLAPTAKDKDSAALSVAEAVLSGGESSRLYQELVYKQQIAQEAQFNFGTNVDKGVMNFTATMASGKTVEEGEKSLLAELKKMQDSKISETELEKAKNTIIANNIRRLETNKGKTFALGYTWIMQGDPTLINEQVKKIQAVTVADVQRVMKKYFTDNNRVVIYYENEESAK